MRRQATHWTISLQRAVAASILVAVSLLATMWFTQQSTQADLRLSITELRARAAELALVARALEEHRISPTAARVLALQLRDKTADLAMDLKEVEQDSSIAGAVRASDIGREVTATADRVAEQPIRADATEPLLQRLPATVQMLMTLERDLRPK